MYLNIGNKRISLSQALECYKDKKTCKRRFGISSKEYDILISAMLKAVKAGVPQPQPQSQPQPQPQPQPPYQFPVQSYAPQQSQYAALDAVNQSILPGSYAPIQSTQQLAQQFNDTENMFQQHMRPGPGSGPGQGADWYEQQTMQEQIYHNQLTNLRNHTQSNQNLFDRRFFQGQQTHAQQIPPQPIPLRFDDSIINRTIRQQDRNAIGVQPEMADHKIFSRTFDLTQQQIPDRGIERQSIGCRRGATTANYF